MARLLLLTGGESKAYELDGDEVVVGRLPECEIHLDSNMISRKHARLKKSGTNVVIEDLGSGNGTFVNGQRITGVVTLQHDDRVKFGPLLTRFESDAPP
ncbi:MAG TPA: FHA domain-containing protein, partial [Caulifigura sp.]|nr:FHA domain-containing protein [Caulifigura sp.]